MSLLSAQCHQIYTQTFNFIAGRLKAALLFWLFGDFRSSVCGYVSLFLLDIKIENRLN